MTFTDLVRLSFRQVIRHRRRYWGVILTITLGIASLNTVIMASRDFKRHLANDLTLIGGVTILNASFDNHLTSRPMTFQPKTITALGQLPGVEEVSALALQKGRTTLNTGKPYHFTVIAVDEVYWRVRSLWAQTGRLFGRDAVVGRKRVCVLGEILARKIFGQIDLNGLTVNINNEPYQVTGVLGGITDSALASRAYLPITTVADRFPGLLLVDRIYLRCATLDDVAPVAAAIPREVQRHQSIEELEIGVSWEGLRRVQRIFWWAELFIHVAIGATLLLGAVGIWNVMVAAVRSRTREIGLKKAVGADDVDIFKQFLAEALGLSLASSFLGIALGWITVTCLSYIIDMHPPEYLFLLCAALGLFFGVFLGIGAGLIPSIRASRMQVVDAVRYE